MSDVSVDLSELGKLQTLLAGASNIAQKEMPQILDSVADAVVVRAKSLAPVDTGDLQADLGEKERAGNQLARSRVVGSYLKQARFTEFGTSMMPPQPWLSPAADAGIRQLAEEMGRLGAPW